MRVLPSHPIHAAATVPPTEGSPPVVGNAERSSALTPREASGRQRGAADESAFASIGFTLAQDDRDPCENRLERIPG